MLKGTSTPTNLLQRQLYNNQCTLIRSRYDFDRPFQGMDTIA
jgi:hypothetical protein